MDLKALGLRFALGYLMSRASGNNQKDAAVDSLFGSTIAQAKEDITGFTPEIAEVTQLVIEDLVAGRRTKATGIVAPNQNLDPEEIESFKAEVNNPRVGLTIAEVESEVQQLKEGMEQAAHVMTRLERLQAGVLKRL